MRFLVRWLVTALAVAVALWLIPGIAIGGNTETWVAIAIFALILSLINIILKPLVQIVSLPLTILTLGIFYLVVNALLLYIAAWVVGGLFNVIFYISSFGSAFIAALVISLVSTIVNALLGTNKKKNN